MAFLDISLSDLPESTGGAYDPLPAGWYTAMIAGADLQATKDGTGQYIKIKYSITGPSHQGRIVFGNLNIKNASAKAEEIGRQQLGELMRAIGLARVQDTDQLIGGQLSIKLDIRPARTDAASGKTYDAQNEVNGYKAAGGLAPAAAMPSFGAASQPQAQAHAAPSAPSAASSAPPWAKR
jgi:hypothetical protein